MSKEAALAREYWLPGSEVIICLSQARIFSAQKCLALGMAGSRSSEIYIITIEWIGWTVGWRTDWARAEGQFQGEDRGESSAESSGFS